MVARRLVSAVLLGFFCVATAAVKPVLAQQIAVGPRALGTAGSGAFTASGLHALGASPARLAWNGEGLTQVLLPSGAFRLGLHPVTPRDVARYSGRVLPANVREEWLGTIEREGVEEGTTSATIAPFAVAYGRFAVQLSGSAEFTAAMNPDAVEALLFGNAGRTGTPRALDLGGSSAEGWGLTTLSVGAGVALDRLSEVTGGEWAVGLTAKLSTGHFLWSALDAGSRTTTDPLTLEGVLPVVAAPPGFSRGSGLGVDVGAAWRDDEWNVDLVVRDVVNSFGWDEDDLEFRRGVLAINPDSTFDGSERLPLAFAPTALQSRAGDFAFSRSASLSVSRALGERTRTAIEAACGPPTLEAGRAATLGAAGAVAGDFDPCRGGVSFETRNQAVTLRGGVSAGGDGADVGLGLMWTGTRSELEIAYGRGFGDGAATGVAVAVSLRFDD